MASSSSSSSSGGIGFVGLLTIVFIVLKLVRFHGDPVNTWSWWWVLSPIWISALAVIVILLLLALGFIPYYFVTRKRDKHGR